mgnify:FL=1
MNAPQILMYNLDNPRKLKILMICGQLKIKARSVAVSDYAQPIGALAGLRSRTDAVYSGTGFLEEMLLMANFSGALLNGFLNAMRQNRLPGIPLKAVLTDANADWDSVRLHDEILREHIAMHSQNKK